MLKLKPNCECCDRDLPPDSDEAMVCTFECTFCSTCVKNILKEICINCGGTLAPRPIRTKAMLEKYPPSEKRVLKEGGCKMLA